MEPNFRSKAVSRFMPDVRIETALVRERLLLQLDGTAVASASMTILRAPAGFGKTTLYAQYLRQLKASGITTIWMNAQSQDRMSSLSDVLSEALHHSGLCGFRSCVRITELLAQVSERVGRFALFIDNDEWLDTEADAQLIELARELPDGVSCYLAGRRRQEARLSQYLLGGYVRLIGPEHLAFTFEEAASLFTDGVPSEALTQAWTRSEGWPAVMQLMAHHHAFRSPGNREASFVNFNPMAAALVESHDYVASQILAPLPDEERRFLLDTSILDEVTVDIANAVLERSDSANHIAWFAGLAPLIKHRTDATSVHVNPWLRESLIWHARLIGDDVIARRHLRAANAYAAHQDLIRAVDQAIQAGEPETAARIVEHNGAVRLIADAGIGRTQVLLSRLPSAVRQAHPRLRLLYIAHLLTENNAREACWDMERLQRELQLAEPGSPFARLAADENFQLEVSLVDCLVLLNRAEHELIISPWAQLDRVTRLAMVQFCDDWRILGLLLPLQILFLHRYGPLSGAARYIARIELMYRSENSDYNIQWVRFNRARECVGSGHLDQAEDILLKAIDSSHAVIRFEQTSFRNMVAALRARVANLSGELEKALAILEGIEAHSAGLLFEVTAAVYIERARCLYALGDTVTAMAQLDAAQRLADSETLPHLGVLAACTRLVWLADEGRNDEMEVLAMQINLKGLWKDARGIRKLPWADVEAVGRAAIRFALARGDLKYASLYADRLQILAEQMEERPAVIAARLLYMRVLIAIGDECGAQGMWQSALAIAAEGRISQPFVDELVDIAWLEARGDDEPTAIIGLKHRIRDGRLAAIRRRIERNVQLTIRERDVMYWLVQGLATKRISRELGVSPETVKQHLKTIFTKLGVNSRGAATAAVIGNIIPVSDR
ncbi:LuxR C-terminal-related transcriptional regulator [Pseudomonas sp. dw_612]|uniref:helix-turn-helix transcriptional regulator n=1 Tax=Pseudomonas sp. dw_612 TaxID=2720080 RepID=UPI001BD3550C